MQDAKFCIKVTGLWGGMYSYKLAWPQGFPPNSAEHEIFPAYKCLLNLLISMINTTSGSFKVFFKSSTFFMSS